MNPRSRSDNGGRTGRRTQYYDSRATAPPGPVLAPNAHAWCPRPAPGARAQCPRPVPAPPNNTGLPSPAGPCRDNGATPSAVDHVRALRHDELERIALQRRIRLDVRERKQRDVAEHVVQLHRGERAVAEPDADPL